MDISLSRGSTRLLIAGPEGDSAFYRGTRFDRSGNILDLECRDHRYISRWFRHYDPFMHDAVCGPAEEFTQCGFESGGESFLKVGVGLLATEGTEYDRFKLYRVLDPGHYEISSDEASASFRHILSARYDYTKTVSIPRDGQLLIGHSLRNEGLSPLKLYVYCHNFWVLDGGVTGPGFRLTVPFRPMGDWRAEYDCVALTPDGLAFSRELGERETVFMGNLRAESPVRNYSFRIENNGLSVSAVTDATMEYAVFWANHEVACIEPYVPLDIAPRETVSWSLFYKFG